MCIKVILGHEPVPEHFTHYKKTNMTEGHCQISHRRMHGYLEHHFASPDTCAWLLGHNTPATASAFRSAVPLRQAAPAGRYVGYGMQQMEFTNELRRQATPCTNRVYIELLSCCHTRRSKEVLVTSSLGWRPRRYLSIAILRMSASPALLLVDPEPMRGLVGWAQVSSRWYA
jgi:hypothetical protein